MSTLLLVLLGASLALVTYLRIEPRGPGRWLPMLLRAVAWGGMAALLANPGCPAARDTRAPLVLLDGSLSMEASPALRDRALDTAHTLGDVRWFGDSRSWIDSTALRGRSELESALAAALALGRTTVVVTDGELGDAEDIAPDLLSSAGFLVLPRVRVRDLAVTAVQAPARVTVGDSLLVTMELRAFGTDSAEPVTVAVRLGSRVLGRMRTSLPPDVGVPVRLSVSTRGIPSGYQFLTAEILGEGDAEARDDRRLFAVEFAATPGIVMLAEPGDWDARFLFRALREVADLPVKGYVRLEAGRWNDMDGLAAVSEAVVSAASRRADLLIVRGDADRLSKSTMARGLWRWPRSPSGGDEWYASPPAVSPIAMAFLGVPADSLPPLSGARALAPETGDWTGLTAQAGRRGAARPVVVGRSLGRRRELTVGADGFWRWSFRGGQSADVYRALVASSVAWLLAAPDSAAGRVRVVRRVVEQGMPLTFERTHDSLASVAIDMESAAASRRDTLRFGGDGRADLWLPPGTYRYRLAGPAGGVGVAAVDEWSREWLPQPVVVESRATPDVGTGSRRTARQWPWLYALILLALAGEWTARRRLGLR